MQNRCNLNWFFSEVDKGNVTLAVQKCYRGPHRIEIPDDVNADFLTAICSNLYYIIGDTSRIVLCPGVMSYIFDWFYLPEADQPDTLKPESPFGVLDHTVYFENSTRIIGSDENEIKWRGQKEKHEQLIKKLESLPPPNCIGFFDINNKFLPSQSTIVINDKAYNLIDLFDFICKKLPELYYIGTNRWQVYIEKLKNYEDVDPKKDAHYENYLNRIIEKQNKIETILKTRKDPELIAQKKAAKEYRLALVEKMAKTAETWWFNTMKMEYDLGIRWTIYSDEKQRQAEKDFALKCCKEGIEKYFLFLISDSFNSDRGKNQSWILIRSQDLRNRLRLSAIFHNDDEYIMILQNDGFIAVQNNNNNDYKVILEADVDPNKTVTLTCATPSMR